MSREEDATKASLTDPKSRIMKTRTGFTQGYNLQLLANWTPQMQYTDKDGMVVTIYSPNERAGGFVSSACLAVKEIIIGRHLIWSLFVRDFNAQFRQKALGYLWAVLGPILGMFSFIFMNYAGILSPGKTDIPYPLYVLVGTTIWGYLVVPSTSLAGGLASQGDLILRTNVPKFALVMTSLTAVFYGVCVNIVVLSLILVVFQQGLSWWALAYPLLILPMIFLGVGVGLISSVMSVIARDLSAIISQALNLAMYVTPVVYVGSTVNQPLLRKVIALNPLSYLIDVPRSLIFQGHSPYVLEYVLASLMSLAVLLVGIRVFYLIQDLVAERL